MCEEPCEGAGDALQRFLREHRALTVLPPGDKVRCILTGHELPCRLPQLKAYTNGKKYLRLIKALEVLDNCKYEPLIVPSTKKLYVSPSPVERPQLFCNLTLRHINRISAHILRRVQGSCYQKALRKSVKESKCDEEGMKPAMKKGVAKGEKCDPMEVNLQRGTKRAKKQGGLDKKKSRTGFGHPRAFREVTGK